MLRNYFKIALRVLRNQKAFTFINVFGLAVGIACFILLLLYSANEFSFDTFHKKAADIYRPYIWAEGYGQSPIGYTDYSGPGPLTLAEAMKHDLPDVLNYVRLQLAWSENFVRTDKITNKVSLSFADPSLFNVFSFPLKYGNTRSVLHEVNDIVLTESRAKELFGTDEVVGKMLDIQIGTSFQPFRISGVAKNIPPNSTIRFDVLGNFRYAQANNDRFIIGNNWHPTVVQSFIQLKTGSKLPANANLLNQFIERYNPDFRNEMNNALSKNERVSSTFRMQPLLKIHTDADFKGWGFTDYAKIDPVIIWILLAIAIGILLIACINFTTLAIGRSAARAKEVGVRKVMGAGKRGIIFQFLAEALLLSIVSAVFGLILADLMLPWFNRLSGRTLYFSFAVYPQVIVCGIFLVLIVGMLAGSYPAFVLSRFRPMEVLKNKFRIGGSNLFTRSLVILQFAISLVLVVSTIVILQQTKYLINKNPGYDKENIIAIDATQADANKIFPLFKQNVIGYPAISGVATAAAGLGAGQDFLGFTDMGLSADINIVDPDYIKVMGMQLLAGSNFRPLSPGDTVKSIIINQTMMHNFGWTIRTAIGKEIKNFQHRTAQVIGVVKDFNYRSLSNNISNQVFETSTDKGYSHFYVRIKPGNPSKALNIIQKAWSDVQPGIPIQYSFLDEDVSNYYSNEQRWVAIVEWASGISIFLACLGLLGLAALAAVNRTKEIGVRKVLGATAVNIMALLSGDFLKLILVSFVIASPVAWFIMNSWLENYANRINIRWWVFPLAGTGAILIALMTISFQAIKAAISNPVKSLRTE